MSTSAVRLSPEVVCSFQPVKALRNHRGDNPVISSLDFDETGQYALTAGSDESIQLYDCRTGKHKSTVYSKKYGSCLARFTRGSFSNCVYASTKEDDTIRYLSLSDNQYIRYFRGHNDKVTALETSPVDHTLISASLDHSVRLWDFRSSSCHGLINVNAPALVAIDATSTAFAVASPATGKITLYDIKGYSHGPFLTFEPSVPENTSWTKIEFANHGNHLLLATDSDAHFLFDAYTGKLLASLKGHVPLALSKSQAPPSHVTFTVDGKHVFGSSGDNRIRVWSTSSLDSSNADAPAKTLAPIASLDTPVPPTHLAFSPRTMLLATAHHDLTLWLPKELS